MAGGIGAGTTLGLFFAMSAVVDGTSILQRIFRIFPLIRAEISSTDECAQAGTALSNALAIEGTIGTSSGDGSTRSHRLDWPRRRRRAATTRVEQFA